MKILTGLLITAVLVAWLAVQLNRGYRDPWIPPFKPAIPVKKAAAPPPRYPFQIEGQISERRLVHYVVPSYPSWAEEAGLSGTCQVRVTVTPDGFLTTFLQMLQTTGHPRLDEEALQKLRLWRFNPVPMAVGNQTGTISFHFKMARAGTLPTASRPAPPWPALRMQPADAAPLGSDSRQRVARYEDLGPTYIDVSGYPDEQKINYRLFLQRCSRCHTPARALHSPITARKEWAYYVGLMHTWSLKEWLSVDDRRWITDFLAYDSKVRKIDRQMEFQADQQRLREIFEAGRVESR